MTKSELKNIIREVIEEVDLSMKKPLKTNFEKLEVEIDKLNIHDWWIEKNKTGGFDLTLSHDTGDVNVISIKPNTPIDKIIKDIKQTNIYKKIKAGIHESMSEDGQKVYSSKEEANIAIKEMIRKIEALEKEYSIKFEDSQDDYSSYSCKYKDSNGEIRTFNSNDAV